MAFTNVDSLPLGELLQIVFSEGVRTQISEDYRDWEMVKQYRVGNTAARELRFMFLTSFGPAAVQYRTPGKRGRSFPKAQQSTIEEHTAKFKELQATIELEYNLYDRARKSPEKYAEPLALEIQSKSTAHRRRLAADWYGDGTGVMGTVASGGVADDLGAPNETVITLEDTYDKRGFIGWAEEGDLWIAKQNDGSARAPTETSGSDFYAWRVKDKDRENAKVTLEPVDENGDVVADVTASNLAATDVFYRIGQDTIPDLSAITSSTDYGTLTEVYAGLLSLAAADSRTIHGISMTGASKATHKSAGGNPLDAKYIQQVMDQVKVRVGKSVYNWKLMCMAPEAHAAFVDSRETDRRFHTVEDAKRGIRYFAYQHEEDDIRTYSSEFCQKGLIYIKPEQKSGKKVFEMYGSDLEPVKMSGMGEFHLKPDSTGGYVGDVQSFLQGILVPICKHPAAIGVVKNFTL